MAMQKKLQCPKCDRRFALPAHLARHAASAHGGPKKKAGRPRRRRKGGRKAKAAPRKGAARFELSGFTLTDLCQLIDAARAEAGRRLGQL